MTTTTTRTGASHGAPSTDAPDDDADDDPEGFGDGDGPGVVVGGVCEVACPRCPWKLRYLPHVIQNAHALLTDHQARAHRPYTDVAWTALQRAIVAAGAVDCMDDPDLWYSPKRDDIARAISVCETCPIAFECLDYALTVDFLQGVWATTTPAERKYLRQIGTESKGR